MVAAGCLLMDVNGCISQVFTFLTPPPFFLNFTSCLGETTVETYDLMFTVTSRVRFAVTKEDDGVPVDCIIDHPAAKDLMAQRSLEVQCE